MKILFITGAFPPMKCGVGDYTASLVASLETFSGVTPGVCTSTSAAGCSQPPSVFFPVIDRWSYLRADAKLRMAVETFRPDIIHLQYPASFGRVFYPNFIPMLFNRKIPVVQTWHERPIYSQFANAISSCMIVVVDPSYPSQYQAMYRVALRHTSFAFIPVGSSIQRTEAAESDRVAHRRRFNAESARMIACFGFARPDKGFELLFNVLDPDKDRLVMVCDLDPEDPYQRTLLQSARSPRWKGRCFVTGFLAPEEVSLTLASADAVILPFTDGTTPRNTTVLAAKVQGTFIVTTHSTLRGYHASEHIYYVAPGNTAGIRDALDGYAGIRFEGEPCVATWGTIAEKHLRLYQDVIECRSWRLGNQSR